MLKSDACVDDDNVSISVELTLYDLVIEAAKQNGMAKAMLKFLNQSFEELCDNLQSQEKLLLRSNVRQLLMSADLKFLDFVGEIAVLNQSIKSGNYRLHAIEKRQPIITSH